MGTEVGDDEPWAIELGDEFQFNHPGQGAREMEERAGARKSELRRGLERVLGVHSDERAWRRGAVGEEEVGRRLDRLPSDRWAVVHDLTIGTKGANLDHLVIGPPGVFALNTKHLTGNVTVYDRALLVNGHKTDYYVKSLAEARKVQQRLSATLGREIAVWGVIVLMGCELDLRKRPADLSVIGRRQLPRWFEKQPGTRLSPGDVLEIERAARSTSTWLPRKSAPPSAGRARPPAEETWEADGTSGLAPPSGSSVAEPELTLRRWKRYGHDRIYASLSDGTTAGWIDVPTGRLEIELKAHFALVKQRLEEARGTEG